MNKKQWSLYKIADAQTSRLFEEREEIKMSVQQRRKYDPEFKKNADLLTAEPGRNVK